MGDDVARNGRGVNADRQSSAGAWIGNVIAEMMPLFLAQDGEALRAAWMAGDAERGRRIAEAIADGRITAAEVRR